MTSSNRLVARVELDNGVSVAVSEGNLPLTIGRCSKCDIRLPVNHISREHLQLFMVNGVLCLRDSSTNGTRIGNKFLKDESMSIMERTAAYLSGQTKIRITPIDPESDETKLRSEPIVLEERRAKARDDRRDGERRTGGDRRMNVVAVDFDRRQTEIPRRMQERRTSSRRG